MDENGLSAAMNVHRTNMLRYFTSRTHDVDEAEDLVQQAALNAWAAYGQKAMAPEDWTRVLWTIARNLAIDAFHRTVAQRSRRAEIAESEVLVEQDFTQLISRRGDLYDQVERALERLPDNEREIVELRVLDEQRFDDVAGKLGMSTQKARQAYAHAMQRLRKDMAYIRRYSGGDVW